MICFQAAYIFDLSVLKANTIMRELAKISNWYSDIISPEDWDDFLHLINSHSYTNLSKVTICLKMYLLLFYQRIYQNWNTDVHCFLLTLILLMIKSVYLKTAILHPLRLTLLRARSAKCFVEICHLISAWSSSKWMAALIIRGIAGGSLYLPSFSWGHIYNKH